MKKKNAILLWTTYMVLATSAGIVAAQLVTRRTNLALSAILAICVLYCKRATAFESEAQSKMKKINKE